MGNLFLFFLAYSLFFLPAFFFTQSFTEIFLDFYPFILFYLVLGGLIGLLGVLEKHPYFDCNIFIYRGVIIGFLSSVPLYLIAENDIRQLSFKYYPSLADISNLLFGFIFCCKIMIFCGINDYFATKIFGQGKKLLEE